MSLKEARGICVPQCFTLKYFPSHSASLEREAVSGDTDKTQESMSLEDPELSGERRAPRGGVSATQPIVPLFLTRRWPQMSLDI